ncbi:hypothetical protein ZIOFF_067112 [Zingiber officinale]|uniref:LIM zinc-binding domain-containing protein n=1 Tax=Zingiber officinale TaxID=94328 RepID=A0A8J5CDE6_ZINOF|nr:hypothetical protein ZIOFF_067112 [Zingiber officinale]
MRMQTECQMLLLAHKKSVLDAARQFIQLKGLSLRLLRTKCLCIDELNDRIVYLLKVKVNGAAYHKSCFKCCHGGCVISPSNYIAHDGKLYCKHHHTQLIKEKGNLSQLETDREANSGASEVTDEPEASKTEETTDEP